MQRFRDVRILKTQRFDIIKAIGPLRLQAWKDSDAELEPGIANSETWLEDLDYSSDCTHFVALLGDKIIGSARASLHHSIDTIPFAENMTDLMPSIEFPCLSFNRLFVLKEYRGHGVGGFLHWRRMQWAKQQKARTVVVVAVGEDRRDSIIKQGFDLHGTIRVDQQYRLSKGGIYLLTANIDDVQVLNIPARLHKFPRSASKKDTGTAALSG